MSARLCNPQAMNFFALLWQLDVSHCDAALGTSLRLKHDPIRLGQQAHLDFATQDCAASAQITTHAPGSAGAVGATGAVSKFYIQNFGLLGPNGALPLHFTEHAYNRIHHWQDRSLTEFLDVFQHRAYCLFYRAWAQAQPHVRADGKTFNAQPNPFTRRLSSLVGHGVGTQWQHEALHDHFRLGLAGHFSRRSKTQAGLLAVVHACTGMPASAQPFQAQWLTRPVDKQRPRLGVNTVLGQRVLCAQSKIKVCLGPVDCAAYTQLLPGLPTRIHLFEATHAYLGFEFDVVFEVSLKPETIAPTCLGKAGALGRTSWLGKRLAREVPPVRIQCPAIAPSSSILSGV